MLFLTRPSPQSQFEKKTGQQANKSKRETAKKWVFFRKISLKRGGSGIPKLYVEFWWPLFLAMKFIFLFLNLAKINIFISKRAYGVDSTANSVLGWVGQILYQYQNKRSQ